MPLSYPLRGIITAMVTPLDEGGRLDPQGTENLVRHLIHGGVHGIFILGTTGEAPALTHKQRAELVRMVCRQVDGRLPVIVGVTDTSYDESVELCQVSADAGADAVVTAPPYYFSLSQEDLLRHAELLAADSPLPLFLYNAPLNTHHILQPETVCRAAEIENVVGIKDSGSNMGYFHNLQMLLKPFPDFTFLVGPEELLAESVLLGGHGGMAAGSNVFPRLFVDIYHAAERGDAAETARLHELVMEFGAAVYGAAAYGENPLRGLKCALSELGICGDTVTKPLTPYNDAEREVVSRFLEKYELGKTMERSA